MYLYIYGKRWLILYRISWTLCIYFLQFSCESAEKSCLLFVAAAVDILLTI